MCRRSMKGALWAAIVHLLGEMTRDPRLKRYWPALREAQEAGAAPGPGRVKT